MSNLFILIYENSDTATYLNYADSVAFYRLAHQNILGEPLNSALHEKPIIIGKTLGIIRFFRVDSFPTILKPIQLVGHVGNESGLFAIRHEDLSTFQVGDFFQYKNTVYNSLPFLPNYVEYSDLTILSRTENDTAILYERSFHQFRLDGSVDNTFSSPLTVNKNEVLFPLPFDIQDPEEDFVSMELTFISDSCGGRWRLKREYTTWRYCDTPDSEGCYGDAFHVGAGEPITNPSSATYELGLGSTESYSGGYQNQNSYSTITSLIYWETNDSPCGNQTILSTSDTRAIRGNFLVTTNPATQSFRLYFTDISAPIDRVSITDLQGRLVKTYGNQTSVYDVSGLPAGVYVVSVWTDNIGYTQKLIINR